MLITPISFRHWNSSCWPGVNLPLIVLAMMPMQRLTRIRPSTWWSIASSLMHLVGHRKRLSARRSIPGARAPISRHRAPPSSSASWKRNRSIIQFGFNANAFFYDPTASRAIVVRIAKEDIQAGVREVDAVWNTVAPNVAIQRQFADEALDKSMWMLDMISRVFGSVAIMAIVIAMLGLVGVSIHATHRRVHEIGVRKTLGADARNIFVLLLRDFSKPVLIANVIAWPLAYVLMRAYLSMFTHSDGLSATPFIVSLLITLAVAWVAVSAQVIRAARLNPADVLRYE
jgi:hypothetical protein